MQNFTVYIRCLIMFRHRPRNLYFSFQSFYQGELESCKTKHIVTVRPTYGISEQLRNMSYLSTRNFHKKKIKKTVNKMKNDKLNSMFSSNILLTRYTSKHSLQQQIKRNSCQKKKSPPMTTAVFIHAVSAHAIGSSKALTI